MSESPLVVQLLWQSALVPLAVALVLLVLSRALRLNAVASVLAVTGAFIASYFAILHTQWSLLPQVALDWMPLIALGAAAAALAIEHADGAARRFALRLA